MGVSCSRFLDALLELEDPDASIIAPLSLAITMRPPIEHTEAITASMSATRVRLEAAGGRVD